MALAAVSCFYCKSRLFLDKSKVTVARLQCRKDTLVVTTPAWFDSFVRAMYKVILQMVRDVRCPDLIRIIGLGVYVVVWSLK